MAFHYVISVTLNPQNGLSKLKCSSIVFVWEGKAEKKMWPPFYGRKEAINTYAICFAYKYYDLCKVILS